MGVIRNPNWITAFMEEIVKPAYGAILALGLLTLGCSQPVTAPPPPRVSVPRHVVDASTPIGQETRTTVGSTVIRVKDYWVTTSTAGGMKPNKSFTFTGGPNTASFVAGVSYKVMGTTVLNGRNYTLVAPPGNSMRLLVDQETGALSSKVINHRTDLGGDPTVMMFDFTATPTDITFTDAQVENISSTQGYSNYEFIYSGKVGNTLNFMYREYTAADLVRPAFSQNVTYDANQGEIEFKSIKLKVIEVSNNFIRVQVVAL